MKKTKKHILVDQILLAQEEKKNDDQEKSPKENTI